MGQGWFVSAALCFRFAAVTTDPSYGVCRSTLPGRFPRVGTGGRFLSRRTVPSGRWIVGMATLTADRFTGIRGLYRPPSLRRDARLDLAADALRRAFFDRQIVMQDRLAINVSTLEPRRKSLVSLSRCMIWQSLCMRAAEVTASVNRRTDIIRPSMSAQSDFDAFLTHNSKDKPTARELKRVLEARGLTVWFDEDQLRPGLSWQPLLEQGLQRAGSVIVALGGSGIGPWQNEETQLALNHAHALQRPVIPVLLPDCRDESALGGFLEGRTWVDLRGGYYR